MKTVTKIIRAFNRIMKILAVITVIITLAVLASAQTGAKGSEFILPVDSLYYDDEGTLWYYESHPEEMAIVIEHDEQTIQPLLCCLDYGPECDCSQAWIHVRQLKAADGFRWVMLRSDCHITRTCIHQ